MLFITSFSLVVVGSWSAVGFVSSVVCFSVSTAAVVVSDVDVLGLAVVVMLAHHCTLLPVLHSVLYIT